MNNLNVINLTIINRFSVKLVGGDDFYSRYTP